MQERAVKAEAAETAFHADLQQSHPVMTGDRYIQRDFLVLRKQGAADDPVPNDAAVRRVNPDRLA